MKSFSGKIILPFLSYKRISAIFESLTDPFLWMKNKGEILASVLRNFKGCYFFLHNTKELRVVENIMNEGFIFESQLPNSTDRINPNEPIEITYFFFQRKDYGNYTIVIAIPKTSYDEYSETALQNDTVLEEILTITDPYYSDNDELVYTLSPKHILGYFNIKTSEFFQNSSWDPVYNNCLQKTRLKGHIKREEND